MPNAYKNKVVYYGTTLIDLTADTVTPASLMQGYTAHDASGALIVGMATGGSVSQDADGYIVLGDEAGGGGSGGNVRLLGSVSLGTISSTSTSEILKKTVTVEIGENCLPFVAIVTIDTLPTVNRLLGTTTALIPNIASGTTTENGYNVTVKGSNSNQTASSNLGLYGIYPKGATIDNGVLTVPICTKYNSSYTSSISGSYTLYVYGFDVGAGGS